MFRLFLFYIIFIVLHALNFFKRQEDIFVFL